MELTTQELARILQLQDDLLGALVGLARTCVRMEDISAVPPLLIAGLSATQAPAQADPLLLTALLEEAHAQKAAETAGCASCLTPCGRFSDFSMQELHCMSTEVQVQKHLLLCALHGIAAQAHALRTLGTPDAKAEDFLLRGVFFLGEYVDAADIHTLVQEAGTLSLHCDALLRHMAADTAEE